MTATTEAPVAYKCRRCGELVGRVIERNPAKCHYTCNCIKQGLGTGPQFPLSIVRAK
jgi:hypothetical protein